MTGQYTTKTHARRPAMRPVFKAVFASASPAVGKGKIRFSSLVEVITAAPIAPMTVGHCSGMIINNCGDEATNGTYQTP
jgi:hypothetical protein